MCPSYRWRLWQRSGEGIYCHGSWALGLWIERDSLWVFGIRFNSNRLKTQHLNNRGQIRLEFEFHRSSFNEEAFDSTQFNCHSNSTRSLFWTGLDDIIYYSDLYNSKFNTLILISIVVNFLLYWHDYNKEYFNQGYDIKGLNVVWLL